MDNIMDGYEDASIAPPSSTRSTILGEIRDIDLLTKDQFTITKMINSDIKDWNGILQRIDSSYDEYLRDPMSLSPDDLPECALTQLVQKLRANQTTTQQIVNQETTNNRLDELIDLLREKRVNIQEINPIQTATIPTFTTPTRIDQQRLNTETPGQYHRQSDNQNNVNQRIFPQTPMQSPFLSGYHSMGSSYFPPYPYLEPLLESDKELTTLKQDCTAFEFHDWATTVEATFTLMPHFHPEMLTKPQSDITFDSHISREQLDRTYYILWRRLHAALSQCLLRYSDLKNIRPPDIHKLWTTIRNKKLPTTPEEQQNVIYGLLTQFQETRTVNEFVNHILRTNSILETTNKRIDEAQIKNIIIRGLHNEHLRLQMASVSSTGPTLPLEMWIQQLFLFDSLLKPTKSSTTDTMNASKTCITNNITTPTTAPITNLTSSTDKFCTRCRKHGHDINECSIFIRETHSPNDDKFCRYCKRTGHLLSECRTKIRNDQFTGGKRHFNSGYQHHRNNTNASLTQDTYSNEKDKRFHNNYNDQRKYGPQQRNHVTPPNSRDTGEPNLHSHTYQVTVGSPPGEVTKNKVDDIIQFLQSLTNTPSRTQFATPQATPTTGIAEIDDSGNDIISLTVLTPNYPNENPQSYMLIINNPLFRYQNYTTITVDHIIDILRQEPPPTGGPTLDEIMAICDPFLNPLPTSTNDDGPIPSYETTNTIYWEKPIWITNIHPFNDVEEIVQIVHNIQMTNRNIMI